MSVQVSKSGNLSFLKRIRVVFALFGLIISQQAKVAFAETTILDAMREVSKSNPALKASSAKARATEKNLQSVKAGYFPTIYLAGQTSVSLNYLSNPVETNSRGVYLQISQPIFDGFRTRNLVGQANSQIAETHEDLRETEQTTLLNAANAFILVSSNREILEFNRQYEKAIAKQHKTINAMHRLGDVSGTDVAQVKVRFASAQAQTSQSRIALESSIAEYVRIVGEIPGDLVAAPAIDGALPANLQTAINIGLRNHPGIFAATHRTEESQYLVGVAKSDILPSLTIQGTAAWDEVAGLQTTSSAVTAKLTFPLFDGGKSSARLQKAKIEAIQRQSESKATNDNVVASIVTSWNQLRELRYRMGLFNGQLLAAKTALNGIKESYKIGERSTYDVLNAEQDVLNSNVNQVITRRDFSIATYALAQSIGILDMAMLENILVQLSHAKNRQPRLQATGLEKNGVAIKIRQVKLARTTTLKPAKLLAFRNSIIELPIDLRMSLEEPKLMLRKQSFD